MTKVTKTNAVAAAIRTTREAANVFHGAEKAAETVVEYLRSKGVLPRANAKDESAKDYASYLAGFKPNAEIMAEFKFELGVLQAEDRDRKLGVRRYARTADGKVRKATSKDKDEACFTLSAVAAFTREESTIAALPGVRGDLTSERGLWCAERETVQNSVSQKYKRLRARGGEYVDATTGKTTRGPRSENKGIMEIIAEAHLRAIKTARSTGAAPWEEVQRVLKDAEQRIAALVDARKLDA